MYYEDTKKTNVQWTSKKPNLIEREALTMKLQIDKEEAAWFLGCTFRRRNDTERVRAETIRTAPSTH